MIHWSEDCLWQKSRLLVARAKQHGRESPLFAFWSTLALEMLARSTLASINICLLADLRGDDQTSDNLFYASGLEIEAKRFPVSIAAKTVFSRCERIIPQLVTYRSTRDRLVRCRNEDVHSGGPGFQGIKSNEWIADYYQMCRLLLSYRQLSLTDMFGTEEASLAEKVIADQRSDERKKALDLVAQFRRTWSALSIEERIARSASPMPVPLRVIPSGTAVRSKCPACENVGTLIGVRALSGSMRLDGNSLTQDVTYLPEVFTCSACSLRLRGYEELRAADFPAEFTVPENPDPVDFHEIDISDYVDESSGGRYDEAEYGND